MYDELYDEIFAEGYYDALESLNEGKIKDFIEKHKKGILVGAGALGTAGAALGVHAKRQSDRKAGLRATVNLAAHRSDSFPKTDGKLYVTHSKKDNAVVITKKPGSTNSEDTLVLTDVSDKKLREYGRKYKKLKRQKKKESLKEAFLEGYNDAYLEY